MPTESKNAAAVRGVVFDIQRGSMVDGPGIRTTVFLKGCPLRCVWCHNPESWSGHPETVTTASGAQKTYGRWMQVAEVMETVRRDRAFYRRSGGGLTLSGGEPMASYAFTYALAQAAHAEGIHVVVDTAGWGSRAQWAALLPFVDMVLFDLKHSDPAAHLELTGKPLEPLLETLRYLAAAGMRIRLRCPILPGLQDIDRHLQFIVQTAAAIPQLDGIDCLPHHRAGAHKHRELGLPAPPQIGDISHAEVRARLAKLQSCAR